MPFNTLANPAMPENNDMKFASAKMILHDTIKKQFDINSNIIQNKVPDLMSIKIEKFSNNKIDT